MHAQMINTFLEKSSSRPWWIFSVMQLSIFTAITFGIGFVRHRIGWQISFDKLYTGILACLIVVIVSYVFRRQQSKLKPSMGNGVFLKVLAIGHGIAAMAAAVLALEPSSQSAWAPHSNDSWAAWGIVLWLWIVAVLSYLAGDVHVRLSKLDRQLEPK
jgi:predicted membrane protein